jgi:hypothetical protein
MKGDGDDDTGFPDPAKARSLFNGWAMNSDCSSERVATAQRQM